MKSMILQPGRSLPERHRPLIAASAYGPATNSLLLPSPAFSGTQTTLRASISPLQGTTHSPSRSSQAPRAHGPFAPRGYVVHPHLRYYSPIRPSWQLPPTSRLFTAYRSGLCHAEPSWLPPRGSLLYLSTPSIRADARTPGGGLDACTRFFSNPSALPKNSVGRLLQHPDTGFCQDGVTTLQRSRYVTARMVARPPVPVRPEDFSPAAEDFYARAFPGKGHPSLESGITTRHHRADTVAGLSPAGVVPLQATGILPPKYSRTRPARMATFE